MRGWFAAKCPVDTWEKTWLETRMRWLADQFGIARLMKARVLLPTAEEFPEPFSGTEADARRIMGRLCSSLGVDPGAFDLGICDSWQLKAHSASEDPPPGGRPIIWVVDSELNDFQLLAATVARGLSAELLLGRGLIAKEARDFWELTDLAPVFFGAGVFAANATITEVREESAKRNVSFFRHGYLTARSFGYAFALFAFHRGETDPEWASALRLDASSVLRKGLKYLQGGGETLFDPAAVRSRQRPLSPREAVRRLAEGSASVRLATLWEIGEQGVGGADVVDEVERCLADTDPALSAEAARTLACLGPEARAAVPALIQALQGRDDETRASAATTLGALGVQPDEVVPALNRLLEQTDPRVIHAASDALGRFGPTAEAATGPLLEALIAARIDCDEPLVENLAGTLHAVTPDPIGQASRLLAEHDRELRRLALRDLRNRAEDGHEWGAAESG